MQFSNSLTAWYLQNKRDLPWRNTTNPYKIWLSEIMLQQTRVAQGLPYFLRFIERFPTVFDLANASEEEVLKLWQGLGYYSRARNLHATAKIIANDYAGNFPNNFKELLKLKGVGDYTAAAIASFSFNEVIPVVDGNVYRVLARYFDIETNIALPKAKKEFFELASELISKENPALFNQAIMEFGALQCVPQNPDCSKCVLNSSCLALQKKKVSQLPVKIKTLKITHRYLNYIIVEDEDQKTIISKRDKKGIWHNLYEFPLIETDNEVDIKFISKKVNEILFKENKIISISEINENEVLHKLSHQTLHIKFWKVLVDGKIANSISLDELIKFPFPIVIYNFIEKHW
ncbi:MAG: A/G-specific adenine glycosylase [Flavobacterium sp.]|uniref:A/G-specific adenine glycosylase n=1 Tax=Flavobacterium sp. TaxID=239 RepID=UPI0022BDE43A|nr:A/G-specific adenine glycosylase [Flavobacterium sp.]MCZ8196222.1 A/G-specific adenine glycosylase [Flavobacterium sp.]